MSVAYSGDKITFADGSTLGSAWTGFKNRILNGSMMIDQRNAGASVTPTNGQYTIDRWNCYVTQASKFTVQQNAGSVTPPTGFTKYLGITSSSSYSVASGDYFTINQPVEGFNTADFSFGTAGASQVTVSFWVRSSLTGTFGGSLQNGNQDYCYPFNYTISSANTWEQKTVTVTAPTSGTWFTTNQGGIYLSFALGVGSTYSGTAGSWASGLKLSATGATSVVGTSGATFYITGVQLEKGSTATSFDYRPYGTELALCQRYYYKVTSPSGSASTFSLGMTESTTVTSSVVKFPISMRIAPTALEQSGTTTDYIIRDAVTNVALSSVPTFGIANLNSCLVNANGTSLTAGRAVQLRASNTNAYLAWSAEL